MQLVHGLAAGLLDARQRLTLALALRVVAQQAAHAARLQDHHRDAVRDGVVQLAGDPRALLDDRGAGLLLALELDAHDVALGGPRRCSWPRSARPAAQASR